MPRYGGGTKWLAWQNVPKEQPRRSASRIVGYNHRILERKVKELGGDFLEIYRDFIRSGLPRKVYPFLDTSGVRSHLIIEHSRDKINGVLNYTGGRSEDYTIPLNLIAE